MKCYECGAENVEGASFCRYCGASLERIVLTADTEDQWYYSESGQTKGPYRALEMAEYFKKQKIDVDTYVWREGMDDWQTYGSSAAAQQLIDEEKKWFCRLDEQLYGPMDPDTLKTWYEEQRIQGSTEVFEVGMDAWIHYNDTGWIVKKEPEVLPGYWFYLEENEKIGPFTKEEMVERFYQGQLRMDTKVWTQGMDDWIEFHDSDLADQIQPVYRKERKTSKRWVAILSAVLIIGMIGGFWAVRSSNASHQQQITALKEEKEKAEKDKEKAEAAKKEAEEAKKQAEEEKKKAQKAKDEAEQARLDAEKAQKEAEAAKKEAEDERDEAIEEYEESQKEQKESSPAPTTQSYRVNVGSGNVLNVRKSPSTDAEIVGTYEDGETIKISTTVDNKGMTWGKTSGGWVCISDGNYNFVS